MRDCFATFPSSCTRPSQLLLENLDTTDLQEQLLLPGAVVVWPLGTSAIEDQILVKNSRRASPMRDNWADSETGQNRKHVLGRHVYSHTRRGKGLRPVPTTSQDNLGFATMKKPGILQTLARRSANAIVPVPTVPKPTVAMTTQNLA